MTHRQKLQAELNQIGYRILSNTSLPEDAARATQIEIEMYALRLTPREERVAREMGFKS